jgi:Trk K+ transport system NAD-binding subunit
MTAHEAKCGVRHVRGRLFHGLRRSMEKLVALETTDEAVRDLAGRWVVGGGTRPAIYTDAQDEDRRAMAATARDAAINRVSGALASVPFLNSLGLEAARIEEKAREVAREFGRTDLDRVIAAARELREALEETVSGSGPEPPG